MMTSLRELELKYNLKAYPNPSSNSLFIEFKSPSSLQANLKIFDSFGKSVLISKRNIVSGKNLIEVNLSQLPKGTYQFSMQGIDLDLFGKFVKIE